MRTFQRVCNRFAGDIGSVRNHTRSHRQEELSAPVNQQRQGSAADLPGQSGGCVLVQVSGGRMRKQEDLRGLLIRNRRWLDGGGVVINFHLTGGDTNNWTQTTFITKFDLN